MFKGERKKGKKRKLTKGFEMQVSDMIKNKKIKTMIDFNKRESNSIKSIVVNSSTTVDVSTRFCQGKILMFAKMPLKSFAYNIIDVFVFLMIKSREFLIKTTLTIFFYILI